MANFTQTFIKGMNSDTDISSLPQGSYRLAENLTFTTIENGTSGALENVKGNVLLNNMNSVFGTGDNEIVGYINIIDDIVFFTYQASTNTSSIWVYTHSTNSTTLFYTDKDGYVIDNTKLNFSTDPERRIVGIGRYENEKVRKIYWTDGKNEIRYANLERSYLDDASSLYLSINSFSLLPNFSLGSIILDANSLKSGGSLKAGAVQYFYKFYNKYGAETTMSSGSRIMSIMEDSPGKLYGIDGNDIEDKVYKSVKLNLKDIDTSFEYIKVYRAFYQSYYDLPTISLIYDINITNEDLELIDTGNSILEIPFEEFNSIGGRLFTAKALASKNNYLFAANIKEEYFDANLDCRAYRFSSSETKEADFQAHTDIQLVSTGTYVNNWEITSGDLSEVHCSIDTNGYVHVFGKGTYELSAWVLAENTGSSAADAKASVGLMYSGGPKLESSIVSISNGSAETLPTGTLTFLHDGIDRFVEVRGYDINSTGDLYFKDTTYVQQLNIKFTPESSSKIVGSDSSAIEIKSDGSWEYTSGGTDSGTDWSIPETYDCINPTNDIYNNPCDITDTVNTYIYSATGGIGGTGKIVSYEVFYQNDRTIVSNAKGYDDKELLVSYTHKRGEVYRYGMVFFDKKGRQSFVNWIGDIYIPFSKDTDSADPLNYAFSASEANCTVSSKKVVIRFGVNINNIPSDLYSEISGFKIVYVERKFEDSFGKVYGALNHLLGDSTNTELRPWGTTLLSDYYADYSYDNYFQLLSPDITIGEVNIESSQYKWKTLGFMDYTYPNTIEYPAYPCSSFPNEPYGVIGTDVIFNTSTVVSAINVGKTEKDYAPYILSSTLNYYNRPAKFYPNDVWHENYGPTSGAIVTQTPPYSLPTDAEIFRFLFMGVLYSDVFNTQYGGNTYSNRLSNIYIPASITMSGIDAHSVGIYTEGDSFVSIYSQMMSMWDVNNTPGNEAWQSSIMFPVESKIRTSFVNTDPFKYTLQHSYSPDNMSVMEKQADGIAMWPDVYPDELGDLYTYNNVYSLPAYGLYPKYTPKPLLFEADQTNHVAIIASEEKTNGETIDNWTKFLYSNILEVDTAYGGINELKSLDNKLFFWQDSAFGQVAVNDRSLITDQSGAQLSLGSGGVLERYDYYSNNIGVLEKYNVINSENALFWVFTPLEKIYLFDNQVKELSTVAAVNSYLHNKAPFENPICMVDYTNHETLFKIKDEVLVYSWLSNSFTGLYTFDPSWFVRIYNGNYASVPASDNHTLWEHNDINVNRANFYNSDNDSYIHFIVNKDYRFTKVFDSIDWFSTSIKEIYKTTIKNNITFEIKGDMSWSNTLYMVGTYKVDPQVYYNEGTFDLKINDTPEGQCGDITVRFVFVNASGSTSSKDCILSNTNIDYSFSFSDVGTFDEVEVYLVRSSDCGNVDVQKGLEIYIKDFMIVNTSTETYGEASSSTNVVWSDLEISILKDIQFVSRNPQHFDTFSEIRVYDDYQNTDWKIIYTDPDSSTYNVARRERSFFMQMPRDKVNKPQKDNVYIFDSAEWDQGVKYKQRMRDKFIHIEMKYDNSQGNKFFFPYVNVNYRQSIR